MKTHSITKAMIETTVRHGIREMEEDPKRSVRRLADLGKQFSKGRFQTTVFSIMQEVLSNEDSAYYDMMANLLKNTDHNAMQTIGVNCGYMSWTYGARRIREYQDRTGGIVPCQIMFRFDPSAAEGLTADAIDKLVTEGEELGIYSYYIRQKDVAKESYQILSVFAQHPDSAFIWLRETGRITAAQIQMLKTSENILTVFPIYDQETILTTTLLKEQKVLFALYASYNDSTLQNLESYSVVETILASESAIALLVSDDGTSEETIEISEKYCYTSRMKQDHPCFLMDYYADIKNIGYMTVGHRHILEIGEDGTVTLPESKKGMAYPFEKPLEEALEEIF